MPQTDKKEKLRSFLEQMYGRPISDEELKEYKQRIIDVFSVLIEVDQRNKKKSK